MKRLEEIGPIIEHTYKINNAGPFSVNFFQLIVEIFDASGFRGTEALNSHLTVGF